MSSFPPHFEKGAEAIFADLADVDDDDTVRPQMILDEMIEAVERDLVKPALGKGPTLVILNHLRASEPTATRLRAMIRRQLGKLAEETAG